MKRIAKAVAVCLLLVGAASAHGDDSASLPVVKSGELPLYPPLARMARVQGEVTMRVTTDGEKVRDVQVKHGQPMLAKAARANVETWHFVPHTPTVFVTTFVFNLSEQLDCAPVDANSRAVLTLPTRVEITAARSMGYYCDPNAGLDLSEPLRVFLTGCEVDGVAVSCDKVSVTLTDGARKVKPERFTEQDGSTGFIVPTSFTASKAFGAIIETPKGTFQVQQVNGAFLKGKWRLVIDHAPFQEELRYLAHGKNCFGLIHFEWGEPEVLAVGPCE